MKMLKNEAPTKFIGEETVFHFTFSQPATFTPSTPLKPTETTLSVAFASPLKLTSRTTHLELENDQSTLSRSQRSHALFRTARISTFKHHLYLFC